MAIKKVEVTIKGDTPLLMHRFPMEPIEAIERKTPEEQAEIAAYRDEDGGLYIPGEAMQRALISGATYSKGKGRSSLQRTAAACLMVTPMRLGLGTKKFVVDARSVVIPSTKGRVIRYRPRLDAWQVSFGLEFDPDLMTEQQVRRIVDDTGKRVGLLDFRPERKGMFGRFSVTKWDN